MLYSQNVNDFQLKIENNRLIYMQIIIFTYFNRWVFECYPDDFL